MAADQRQHIKARQYDCDFHEQRHAPMPPKPPPILQAQQCAPRGHNQLAGPVLGRFANAPRVLVQHGADDDVASLDPATSMALVGQVGEAVGAVEGPGVWQMGQFGIAAMQVGIAEAALDQIVEYAKVRETFGRKIGT